MQKIASTSSDVSNSDKLVSSSSFRCRESDSRCEIESSLEELFEWRSEKMLRGVCEVATCDDFAFDVNRLAIAERTLPQWVVDFVESFTESRGRFFSFTVNLKK